MGIALLGVSPLHQIHTDRRERRGEETGNREGKVVLTEEIVENISRSSGIETHKIRAECQNFLKIALPKIDVKKMEENLFRMYDTNMDGIISMQEFLIVYHIFSEGSPEDNLTKIFRIFDVDNNGVISKSELRKLVLDMSGIMKRSHNPNLAVTEDDITDSTWLEMDRDRDGSVTRDEFISSVLNHKKFSKLLAMQVIDLFT